MARTRSLQIVSVYIFSLLLALALLVVWVVYVVQSASRIDELVADRMGTTVGNAPWIVLAVGCALSFLLIIGLTSQLANTFAERRYARKQEEFISNMTHEMKSPIAAIKLHAQTLQAGVDGDATDARSLAFILQQADRMAEMVDDVLESSRLVARKRRLDLEPVDLYDFLAIYLPEARAQVERHGVHLVSRLMAAPTVMATEEALRRVLDNLLDNAARFSEDGGEVRLSLREEGSSTILEVADDGLGIPKKELAKIFDRFYQASHSNDGRRRGTGLGLSIVSGLVREMRGSIRAYSQEGRPGTRFRIVLPTVSSRSGGASRTTGAARHLDPTEGAGR